MVRAWYLAPSAEAPGADQRFPHEPIAQSVDCAKLLQLGVQTHSADLSTPEGAAFLDAFCATNGLCARDQVTCSPAGCGGEDPAAAYTAMLARFYREHLHEDDEIRAVTAGTGYFDVRDDADRWIRVAVGPADLLVLPAGIYHRFTTDCGDFLCATRLFTAVPSWTPVARPDGDSLACRGEYVRKYISPSAAASPSA